MWMAPSPNDDKIASRMEKVTWAFTHASVVCLEATSFLIFAFPNLPSNKASKRIFAVICSLSFFFGCLLSALELRSPAKEFHVYQFQTDLFGDGGPSFVLTFSLLSAIPYAALISLRLLLQKSGARRSSTYSYCIVMLGIQGTRTLGGILLYHDVKFGLCLDIFMLFTLVEFVPPFVFMCVLCPYMQNRHGHSLLSSSLHQTTEEDWMEDDSIGFNQRNDPIGFMRKDETVINEDDYEL